MADNVHIADLSLFRNFKPATTKQAYYMEKTELPASFCVEKRKILKITLFCSS